MSHVGNLAVSPNIKLAPDEPVPINILHGLPDDGRATVYSIDNGRNIVVVAPGTVGIEQVLPRESFSPANIFVDENTAISDWTGPGPLLNHVADPDICSKSLARISGIVAKIPKPCFNYPEAVARTARDSVSSLLAGIEHLDVPKTIRIVPPAPERLPAMVEAAGMRFPVLVRVGGSHEGKDLVRVDSPEASSEIRKLPRAAKSLYVTQFLNVASPDGRYRKSRIVIVGGEIVLVHCVTGSAWNVHAASRLPDSIEEERQAIESFDEKLAPRLRPMFLEIARRIGLDYFGVDCHIGDDGRVTLFEANAAMLILWKLDPSITHIDAPIARVKALLFRLLATPHRWQDYPRYLARTQGTEARARA